MIRSVSAVILADSAVIMEAPDRLGDFSRSLTAVYDGCVLDYEEVVDRVDTYESTMQDNVIGQSAYLMGEVCQS